MTFADCGHNHPINGKEYPARTEEDFEVIIKLFLKHFKSKHRELYDKKLK